MCASSWDGCHCSAPGAGPKCVVLVLGFSRRFCATADLTLDQRLLLQSQQGVGGKMGAQSGCVWGCITRQVFAWAVMCGFTVRACVGSSKQRHWVGGSCRVVVWTGKWRCCYLIGVYGWGVEWFGGVLAPAGVVFCSTTAVRRTLYRVVLHVFVGLWLCSTCVSEPVLSLSLMVSPPLEIVCLVSIHPAVLFVGVCYICT